MKFSETTAELHPPRADYIDKRWRQLHELELKRGDLVLNYLFLVSGGAAAATLAYIGNVAKAGGALPTGVLWMLGCFAASLLLVGLIKIWLIYKVTSIFKGWRSLVTRYYADQISWEEMLESDERTVIGNKWIIHVLGWSAYLALILGVVIGFVKLQEEMFHGRPEKTASTEAATEATGKKDHRSEFEVRTVQPAKTKSVDRGSAGSSSPSTNAEKEVTPNLRSAPSASPVPPTSKRATSTDIRRPLSGIGSPSN